MNINSLYLCMRTMTYINIIVAIITIPITVYIIKRYEEKYKGYYIIED